MEVVYFMRSKIDMSNHFWNVRGQLLIWRFYFYFVVYSKSNKIIIEYNAHRFSRINSFFKEVSWIQVMTEKYILMQFFENILIYILY